MSFVQLTICLPHIHTHFTLLPEKESKAICSSSIESMSTRITKNQARTKCLIDREDFKHEIKREEAENENARISNVNYIFLVDDDDNDRRLLIPFDVHFNIVLS